MSTTLTWTLRTAPLANLTNVAVVGLFSLLGLMLSLAVLPYVSSETISTMSSIFG